MTTAPENTKVPLAIDIEVGKRIKMRRQLLAMSQAALATKLGVTFQQVQKYESAENRIGASRLQEIAEALQVPVSFFFETARAPAKRKKTDDLLRFLATSDGRALNAAFQKISSPKLRKQIIALVETAANEAA